MGLNSVHPLRCLLLTPKFTPAPGTLQHMSEIFKLRKVHQSSQSFAEVLKNTF